MPFYSHENLQKLSNEMVFALNLPLNAHLRRVNSAFSGFIGLKISHVIQLLQKKSVSLTHSSHFFAARALILALLDLTLYGVESQIYSLLEGASALLAYYISAWNMECNER